MNDDLKVEYGGVSNVSSVIESSLFKDIFGTDEMRGYGMTQIRTEWLDVEAALARAQAKLGISLKLTQTRFQRRQERANRHG